MNISDAKAANPLGGKKARACDSCLRKRARWFCAADDAFLCEACDASVHSANQLASRHERVQLKTSSFNGSSTHEMNSSPVPSWHQGFTRKARTPRHAKGTRFHTPTQHTLPLVPEINGDQDPFSEENEDQLLYRVPVFDPFVSEFCSEMGNIGEEADYDDHGDLNLEELLTCDAELADFAADVESLLRKNDNSDEKMEVKVEDEDIAITSDHFDMELNWDFDCASNFYHHISSGGEDMKKVCSINQSMENIFESSKSDESQLLSQVKNRMFLLRLNYEAVITDWENQGCGCPWTNGVRPQFDLQIACFDGNYINPCGGGGSIDSEREARVSRYREKRRTRLFSKKIRYQVRKLNAEKRPRMKGRFVKRTDNLFRLLPSLANL